MSRKDEFSENKNPSVNYIDWKSDKSAFTYWDKENKKEIKLKLPFSFIVLKETHTVRGYDETNNCQIYSNQVLNISNQEITVQSREGGVLAKGLYNEIKDHVKSKGGNYTKSIYAMLENGDLVTIYLKGSGVKSYGDFAKTNKKSLFSNFVTVKDFGSGKKGKVEFTFPNFTVGSDISKDDELKSDEAYETVSNYISNLDFKEVSETETE